MFLEFEVLTKSGEQSKPGDQEGKVVVELSDVSMSLASDIQAKGIAGHEDW